MMAYAFALIPLLIGMFLMMATWLVNSEMTASFIAWAIGFDLFGWGVMIGAWLKARA